MAMFDLEKNKNTAPVPDKEEYRQFKQKQHNLRHKALVKTIGENFATYSLVAIMLLMVASIWSEVRINLNWTRVAGDALVTIVLYILADINASTIAVPTGKLDDDYSKKHEEYLTLRSQTLKAGVALMPAFCRWQVDLEYEVYLRKKCQEFKIDYDDYMENYHGKTYEELQVMFPIEKIKNKSTKEKLFGTINNVGTSSRAAKIFMLNQVERIKLTPDILLTDGMVRNERGSVGISGEEYIEQHTKGQTHVALTILTGIVAAIPAFTLAQEVSAGAIIYTIFKMALLFFRMASGYSRGAKAYHTIEPKHLQSKIKYLYLYIEFLEKKIYLKLKDNYGIIDIIGDQTDVEDKRQEQVDETGAGRHLDELGDHRVTV